MITFEDLEKSRTYLQKNKEALGLGSSPKPLFVNGEFNEENWCGGDDVIRQFFYYFQDKTEWFNRYIQDDLTIYVRYLYEEDMNYLYIDICYKDKTHTSYYFEWYKNRGHIEKITCDKEVINEKQYIDLLNLLEVNVPFTFKLHN